MPFYQPVKRPVFSPFLGLHSSLWGCVKWAENGFCTHSARFFIDTILNNNGLKTGTG